MFNDKKRRAVSLRQLSFLHHYSIRSVQNFYKSLSSVQNIINLYSTTVLRSIVNEHEKQNKH